MGSKLFLGLTAIVAVVFFVLSTGASGRSTQDGYSDEIVTYRGRALHCIVRAGSGYGEGSGMACDFVRFYNRRVR